MLQSKLFYFCYAVTYLVTLTALVLVAFILFIVVRPFSKSCYRRILWYLATIALSFVAFVADWWSAMELRLYVDADDFRNHFAKEHALIILNHSYDIDWVPIMALGARINFLGGIRTFVKYSLKYFPIFGWAFALDEFIFLHRSYDKDETIIKDALNELSQYPFPSWLILYPEGTWYTKDAHEKSMKYAKEKNLPLLRHHLQPRTKGFVTLVSETNKTVPAVYNVEVIFDEGEVKATARNMIEGRRMIVNIYVKRTPAEDIPKIREGQEEFLREMFQIKDKLKESFIETGDMFENSNVKREEYIKLDRPFYSVFIFLISFVTVITLNCYHLISLFLHGSTFWLFINITVIVTCFTIINYAMESTRIK